jgi:hypothetical protein
VPLGAGVSLIKAIPCTVMGSGGTSSSAILTWEKITKNNNSIVNFEKLFFNVFFIVNLQLLSKQ